MGQPRLNLKGVTTLLVDSDLFTRGLVATMLRGFGMEAPTLGETGRQAQHHLEHHYADLVIIEGALPDMTSADLIRWIRKQEKSPFRFVPVIVMSGYTQLRLISAARDAGANLVVKKPVSPAALFDRITWVARTARPFIETADYIGPDRRFKNIPPPDGAQKRETDAADVDSGNGPVLEQQTLNSAA
jgi:DNA-binding response OmpR family regulator